MGVDYDIEGGYLPLFVQHLKDTSARLGLRRGVDEDQASVGSAAAEVNDLFTWTPAECDAFFRAISVYSRWRPDLIAACVPTRSPWEVWMYLEALEEGAMTLAEQQGSVSGEDTDMHGDESSSNSHSVEDRVVCEPALEVSQDWIDVEEQLAFWITNGENQESLEDGAVAYMEDVGNKPQQPPMKKRGRSRGSGKRRAQSRVRGQVSHPDSQSPPPVRRSLSSDSIAAQEREREALMAHLKVPHLLVLDSILRESEEVSKNKGREDSGALGIHEQVIHSGDVDTFSPDTVIDPVLLALSGGTGPAACQSSCRTSDEGTGRSFAHHLAQDASSLPDGSCQPKPIEASSHPGTSQTFTFSLGSATPASPDQTANAEADVSSFSPRSRRRIQKRLYMRRKRALEKGIAPEGVVGTGIERLKPGKKAERREASVVSIPVPCSETPSDAEVELAVNVSKKCRGLTLPYKLKALFTELGVDATYLCNEGMDLLNVSALGRLMETRSCLEQDNDEMATEAIDGQLIRHLQAAVMSFVTDVIHRAIVWKEREVRLKKRCQVWRHGDQITISAIEHALDAIGARHRSHKEYFKTLEALHGPSNEPLIDSETATGKPDRDSVDLDVEARDDPPGLSLHRDVYPPVIGPPSGWRIGPLACLARTYERETTRTRCGTSAEVDENLMSDETDSDALDAELEDEDEDDAADVALGEAEETRLWEAITYRLDIT